MEYLFFLVSATSIIVALGASYISYKRKVDIQNKFEEFNRKKQEMRSSFDEKSKKMHL